MWEGGRLQCLIVSRGPTTYNALIQNHSDLNEHPFHSFFFPYQAQEIKKLYREAGEGSVEFYCKNHYWCVGQTGRPMHSGKSYTRFSEIP